MSSPFIGEIRLFPYNFAPRGWAFCAGQILPIAQNTALFSLLGTNYGGNGQTTFGLPDLRGRVAMSSGQGPGLANYSLGEMSGVETITLSQSQMPPHTHLLACSSDDGNAGSPPGNFPASAANPIYANAANSSMNPAALNISGGGQPHSNLQPYLILNYCIALEGIFPSRN
jgi:microcystin-dependent protein